MSGASSGRTWEGFTAEEWNHLEVSPLICLVVDSSHDVTCLSAGISFGSVSQNTYKWLLSGPRLSHSMETLGSLVFLQSSSGLQGWMSLLTMERPHHFLELNHRNHFLSLPSLDTSYKGVIGPPYSEGGNETPFGIGGVCGKVIGEHIGQEALHLWKVQSVTLLLSTPQPHTCSIYTDLLCCHIHSPPSRFSHILFPLTRASLPVFCLLAPTRTDFFFLISICPSSLLSDATSFRSKFVLTREAVSTTSCFPPCCVPYSFNNWMWKEIPA